MSRRHSVLKVILTIKRTPMCGMEGGSVVLVIENDIGRDCSEEICQDVLGGFHRTHLIV
jgi:hypothetical protein